MFFLYRQTPMLNSTDNQYSCMLCQKSFISQMELKIHQKFKHKKPTHQNYQNINSSDISDQQQENIKRFRELSKKQVQNSANQNIKISECEQTELQHIHEKQMRIALPGKFDDPSLQKNAFKKIYLCGCSQKVFQNSQNLTLHISKQHNGFPPQGTLYGVCRDLVLKQFQPIQQKMPVIRSFIQKAEFVCGCGFSYARFSSLKFHIKSHHQGNIPPGTIGLPKNAQKELNDQKSSTDKKEVSLTCKACFQAISTNHWICDSCEQWRVCGNCIDSEQKLKQHEKQGHKIHNNQ